MSDPITVMAVGDVSADLPDNTPSFDEVRPLLAKGDVVFGNCEYVYSSEQSPSVTHFAMHAAPPSQAAEFEIFDVMSVANNHALDAGYVGLAGTIQTLVDLGVKPVGAGDNLSEAQAPVVVEIGSKKVAFVAFCTVFPVGYEARPNRGGVSPLRVDTFYRSPQQNIWDPGIAPAIVTVPVAEDVQNYRAAIETARAVADYVVVSQHWGMNPEVRQTMVPSTRTYDHRFHSALEDYELELARLGIDFGADAIVAHHQTSLNGVEIYRGRPIYYGLAALVHHFHKKASTADDPSIVMDSERIEGYPHWVFKNPDTLLTGVALMTMSDDGIEAALVPAVILPNGGVAPLKPGDDRVRTIVEHLERKIAADDLRTTVEEATFEDWALLQFKPA